VRIGDVKHIDEFMHPAKTEHLAHLVERGLLDKRCVPLVGEMPMCSDVYLDIAPKTMGGNRDYVRAQLAEVRRRVQVACQRYAYREPVYLGLAASFGCPEDVAAAFREDIDFVVTDAINQCTLEAALPETLKDSLQHAAVDDWAHAPDAAAFHFGITTTYLSRDTVFPQKAQALSNIYDRSSSIDYLDSGTLEYLEHHIFYKKLNEVWTDICRHHQKTQMLEPLAQAQRNPKFKLMLLINWYFVCLLDARPLTHDKQTNARAENIAVYNNPGTGRMNRWLANTKFGHWRQRSVAGINQSLMHDAAQILKSTR